MFSYLTFHTCILVVIGFFHQSGHKKISGILAFISVCFRYSPPLIQDSAAVLSTAINRIPLLKKSPSLTVISFRAWKYSGYFVPIVFEDYPKYFLHFRSYSNGLPSSPFLTSFTTYSAIRRASSWSIDDVYRDNQSAITLSVFRMNSTL